MGEIDDLHHAENQGQPHGDQGKDEAYQQAIHQGLRHDFEVISISISPSLGAGGAARPRPMPFALTRGYRRQPGFEST